MRETNPSGNQATHRRDERRQLRLFWKRVDSGKNEGLTEIEAIEEAMLYYSNGGHISDRCIDDCPGCNTESYPDKTRYCISCRAEHNHFYNATQLEYECSNCGLLALDEMTPIVHKG